MSRYVNLKLGFLPFVVVTIVAIVFLRRISSSRPGDREQRGQSLAVLTAHGMVLYCFQPCHGSLSCVKTNCGVIRVAGYSVVWDCDPTLISPKEHQKERCGHSRSQRSFITFYSALWNILLSAGFPAMFHMITLEQMFVNDSLQKIFSRRFHS